MHQTANDESEQFAIQSPSSEPTPDHIGDGPYSRGYVTNQDGVASDMMTFIHKFYENYPDKRNADLYLASESYGGILPCSVY